MPAVGANDCAAHLQAGDQRLTDTRQDEQDRCITIKSTGISLYYQMTDQMLKDLPGTVERDGNDFLVSILLSSEWSWQRCLNAQRSTFCGLG